ncbi:VanZ family protein [Paludicola sp. MB14-C6]|uniref:VanZ family protein n=1 Tax=Paludihabitans sp. MB14-C6 TaxID=3070656 RepID=UPI0027DDEE58|nr:VanZ family protein [Paludicola sp. MB14-C6]WMJ22466.1 VanZ family protein [Paludicola sp. MB14-C6]
MKKIILRITSAIIFLPIIASFIYTLFVLFFYDPCSDAYSFLHLLIFQLILLLLSTITLTFSFKDSQNRYKVVRIALWVCFALYLFTLFGILFLDMIRTRGKESITTIFQYKDILSSIKAGSNFIPFHSIYNYIQQLTNQNPNNNYFILFLFGNLLLFCPMGILLPCLFKKTRKWYAFITTMLIGLFLIESLQLIFGMGRFDIDDMILNFIGAVLVYFIAKIHFIQKIFERLYLLQPKEVLI